MLIKNLNGDSKDLRKGLDEDRLKMYEMTR